MKVKHGEEIVYVNLKKALYDCLRIAPPFICKLCKELEKNCLKKRMNCAWLTE